MHFPVTHWVKLLDLTWFDDFRNETKTLAIDSVLLNEEKTRYIFDFYAFINLSYEKGLRKSNISGGFREDIWSFDPFKIIGQSRPSSYYEITHLLSVEKLIQRV